MADVPAGGGLAARWTDAVVRRPWRWLALWLATAAALGAIGSRLGVRSNLEDLFPDDTPAVVAAREARALLPSSNQLVVVFGSPSRDANRAYAAAFCARAAVLPEIAAVECERDTGFFRKNAALWLDLEELERLRERVRQMLADATRAALLDPALTADLPAPASATVTTEADPAADPAADFAAVNGADLLAAPSPADPPRAATVARSDDLEDDPAADFGAIEGAVHATVTSVASGTPTAGPVGGGGRLRVPDDDEIAARFGGADLRNWAESPDGTVLGVKLFPRVPASDVEAAAVLTAQIEGLLAELRPTGFHPEMKTALRGDYKETSAEVASIRVGLAVTSALALLGIAVVQVFAFRSLRALVVVMMPLVVGTAWSLGFAKLTIGYVNLITAFIFSILFGLGNEFGVYAYSRYRESRAKGLAPDAALRDALPTLGAGMRTSAFTTAAAFVTLTLFDFRGFSQFGFLAGSGVVLALWATLLVTPPLILVLHQLWPEADVEPATTRGLRWMGAVTRPQVARVVLTGVVVAAVIAAFSAQELRFDTNFRRLRTPPRDDAVATESEAARLGRRFGKEASSTNRTPILVVTGGIDEARAVHDWLDTRRSRLTRVEQVLSIHTFLPRDQAQKAKLALDIYEAIADKRASLRGPDAVEADRAMALLQPTPFGPAELPAFVRARFIDNQGGLGRYVLVYANGNLADARSVRQVVEQVGTIDAAGRSFRATASFFMLAEADGVIRREGPRAVAIAALTVLCVVFLQLRALGPTLATFLPLAIAVLIFLGAAPALGLELNLFTITVLPSIFGLGIDGTVHLVHRGWHATEPAELEDAAAKVGGAAWIAAVTTVIGFGALWFQDNPGVQTLGSMAVAGLLLTTQVANATAAAWVGVRLGWRLRRAGSAALKG